MDDLIKLARTYRLTTGIAERLRLNEQIIRAVGPGLLLFIRGSIPHDSAQDVFQEALKSIAVSIGNFKGHTTGELWAWCYRITRNKIADHFRSQSSERAQPMPPEELWRLIDASTKDNSLAPADRLDLEYAMKLLRAAKPDCYEFLWQHFIIGLNYADIAEAETLTYDAVRVRISRCLETAKSAFA